MENNEPLFTSAINIPLKLLPTSFIKYDDSLTLYNNIHEIIYTVKSSIICPNSINIVYNKVEITFTYNILEQVFITYANKSPNLYFPKPLLKNCEKICYQGYINTDTYVFVFTNLQLYTILSVNLKNFLQNEPTQVYKQYVITEPSVRLQFANKQFTILDNAEVIYIRHDAYILCYKLNIMQDKYRYIGCLKNFDKYEIMLVDNDSDFVFVIIKHEFNNIYALLHFDIFEKKFYIGTFSNPHIKAILKFRKHFNMFYAFFHDNTDKFILYAYKILMGENKLSLTLLRAIEDVYSYHYFIFDDLLVVETYVNDSFLPRWLYLINHSLSIYNTGETYESQQYIEEAINRFHLTLSPYMIRHFIVSSTLDNKIKRTIYNLLMASLEYYKKKAFVMY